MKVATQGRNPITWVILGALVVLLVAAGMDALRSTDGETSSSTTAVSTESSAPVMTGGTAQAQAYVAQAMSICASANGKFNAESPAIRGRPELEEIAGFYIAAARASETALEELRTLPPPRSSDRAPVDDFLAAIEGELRAVQQVAAAASAGNRARLRILSDKRIDMTHRKDRQAENLLSQLGVTPTNLLRGCPVDSPA